MKCFCTTPVTYFNKLLAHSDREILFVCYHYSSINWAHSIWKVTDTFSFLWFYIYFKWSLQKCKIQVSRYSLVSYITVLKLCSSLDSDFSYAFLIWSYFHLLALQGSHYSEWSQYYDIQICSKPCQLSESNVYMNGEGILTHWGWGHLNYLNARYQGF